MNSEDRCSDLVEEPGGFPKSIRIISLEAKVGRLLLRRVTFIANVSQSQYLDQTYAYANATKL